jgi:arabinofuranosyltransferase
LSATVEQAGPTVSHRPALREAVVLALAVAAGVAGFLLYEARLVGVAGLPLDDSWIHLQFARNLLQGGGYAFVPGEPVSGSTAPLWTLTVMLLHALPWSPVVSVKAVGVLLLWGLGLLTAWTGRLSGLGRGAALGAGLVVVLTPRLLWGSLSGMEIGLYAALCTAGVALHLRRSQLGESEGLSVGATLCVGLATLARPECALLMPLILVDRWLRDGGGRPRREELRGWAVHLALFAVVVAPFVIFNLGLHGRPLPNTFYAKVGDYGLLGALQAFDLSRAARALLLRPVEQAHELIRFSAENHVLLTAAVPLGILSMVRRGRPGNPWLLVLVLVSFPVVRGILAPYKGAVFQHGRYAAHLIPLLTVLGFLGLRVAWDALGEAGWRRRWVAWLTGGLMALNLLGLDARMARTYARNVDDIQSLHVAAGTWLEQNTPAEAVVATHDIGAIGYVSRRQVLDTVGLVTPEVLDYLRNAASVEEGVLAYLRAARPDYLVIMPTWYPGLASRRDLFEPVHEIAVPRVTIAAGNRFVVYRTPWTRSP